MKKSKILLLTLILGITGVIIVYKVAYKPHKTIEEQEIEFTGQAKDLMSKIQGDTVNWQNKIVVLDGVVNLKDASGIVLNSLVYCQLKNINDLNKVSEDQQIKIKGRVIGYDDLLEELKLDQVILPE